MALAWRWILEELSCNPDVSVDSLQGILKEANLEEKDLEPYLKNRLLLHHLADLLVTDSNFCEPSTIALVQRSALPEKVKMVEWLGKPECRSILSNYIQEKRKMFGPSTLKKIAEDVMSGLYPLDKSLQDEAEKVKESEPATGAAEVNDVDGKARHLSVGSEDTTVLINGSPVENHGRGECQFSQSAELEEHRSPSPRSAAEKRGATAIYSSCKRFCRDISSKIFREKDSGHAKAQEEAIEKPTETFGDKDVCEENGFQFLAENVNTKRRKRKADAEESEVDGTLPSQPEKVVKAAEGESMELVAADADNNIKTEKCLKCKKPGKLVCCQSCPVAMHPKCVGLQEIPETEWFCPKCVLAQAQEKFKLYSTLFKNNAGGGDGDEPVKTESAVPSPLRAIRQSEADKANTTPDRLNLREKIPGMRRPALPWNAVEEETLREGVGMFSSKWSKILKFGEGKFHSSRTSVDLKDKWRNMNRCPRNSHESD